MLQKRILGKGIGPYGKWEHRLISSDNKERILEDDSIINIERGRASSRGSIHCHTSLYGLITLKGIMKPRQDILASSEWVEVSKDVSIQCSMLAQRRRRSEFFVDFSLKIEQDGVIKNTSETFIMSRISSQTHESKEPFFLLFDTGNCGGDPLNVSFESSLKLHIYRMYEDYGGIIEGSTPNEGMPITFTLNEGEDWHIVTDKLEPLTKNEIPTFVDDLNASTARRLSIVKQADLDSNSLKSLESVESLCWLRLPSEWEYEELSGISNLVQLRYLFLMNVNMSNETLYHLKPLTNLVYLNLHAAGLTDLSILSGGLVSLKDLHIGNNPLSNSSMDFIMELNDLEVLDIADSLIDEQNVRRLFEKNNLIQLDIQNINVSDSFLLDLCTSIPGLTTLLIDSSQISDSALGKMNLLSELVWLHMGGPSITNEGIAELSSLTNLEDLTLSSNQLDDNALQHLQNLTNLKDLFLIGTKVTPNGVKWLESKIPGLVIELW